MNIVLTGFMATGKSEIGHEISQILNMVFVDTDIIIEKNVGMKISEIFAVKGEKYFRDKESEVVLEVSGCDNCVISTGGGIVLRQTNIDNLRRNGKIINLKTSINKIIERVVGKTDRPLLNVQDKESEIKRLLETRQSYYEKCDFAFDTTDTTPREAAEKIIEILGKSK